MNTRTDPKSVYRRDVSREWWNTQRGFFDVFASAEVIDELQNPNYPNSKSALAWISDVPLLTVTDEAIGIAQILIDERLMPQIMGSDAVHVAIAATQHIDHILSWNVRHLANPNKRDQLRKVLARIGIIAPEIVTPDLLWEK